MAKKKTSPSEPTPRAAKPAAPRRATAASRESAADRSVQPARQGPSYEEIAEAAYRRYLSRGGTHGRDFDDWLEAERELRARTVS
jgi:hypothetical protein